MRRPLSLSQMREPSRLKVWPERKKRVNFNNCHWTKRLTDFKMNAWLSSRVPSRLFVCDIGSLFVRTHVSPAYILHWITCVNDSSAKRSGDGDRGSDTISYRFKTFLFYEIFILKPHLKMYRILVPLRLIYFVLLYGFGFEKNVLPQFTWFSKSPNMETALNFRNADSIVSKFIRTCFGVDDFQWS